MGEPGDIKFEFRDTPEARRDALSFARELQEELARSLPICHIEFVGASDHFHLLIVERQAHQARAMARLGAGMVGALSNGVTSGRQTSAGPVRSIAGLRWRASEGG